METTSKNPITIETTVNVTVAKAWAIWTEPQHIKQWAFASDEWHAPYADNDVKVGGTFKTTMAAKDGSISFDFRGTYENVKPNECLAYGLSDGRKVSITFTANGSETKIVETFDPENENPIEMQRGGWQAILDNYRKYTESI
ncbi:MAG: SRPBCC domain-containing protein [Cytophagaceae bacterium]|nr:SRPBCC domain-containing protein [Cytophagaceae bacterium]